MREVHRHSFLLICEKLLYDVLYEYGDQTIVIKKLNCRLEI